MYKEHAFSSYHTDLYYLTTCVSAVQVPLISKHIKAYIHVFHCAQSSLRQLTRPHVRLTNCAR